MESATHALLIDQAFLQLTMAFSPAMAATSRPLRLSPLAIVPTISARPWRFNSCRLSSPSSLTARGSTWKICLRRDWFSTTAASLVSVDQGDLGAFYPTETDEGLYLSQAKTSIRPSHSVPSLRLRANLLAVCSTATFLTRPCVTAILGRITVLFLLSALPQFASRDIPSKN